METFKLRILTPEGEFYSGNADAIRLKGMEGYFQILAKHMDLMTTTIPHKAKIDLAGEAKLMNMDSAVVKVKNGEVTILTNKAQWISE